MLSTLYVKIKCEVEVGVDNMGHQWNWNSSWIWREFGWKSINRYFMTLTKNHAEGIHWRVCGNAQKNTQNDFWKVNFLFLESSLKDEQRDRVLFIIYLVTQTKMYLRREERLYRTHSQCHLENQPVWILRSYLNFYSLTKVTISFHSCFVLF